MDPDRIIEPIPHVYIPKGADVTATLRRLFPQDYYPHLWKKYPQQFGVNDARDT